MDEVMQRGAGCSAHVGTKTTVVAAGGAAPVFSQDAEPQYSTQTSKKGRFSDDVAPLTGLRALTLQRADITPSATEAFLSPSIPNLSASVFPECSAARWLPGRTADAHHPSGFRGNTQPLSALLQHADGLQHR